MITVSAVKGADPIIDLSIISVGLKTHIPKLNKKRRPCFLFFLIVLCNIYTVFNWYKINYRSASSRSVITFDCKRASQICGLKHEKNLIAVHVLWQTECYDLFLHYLKNKFAQPALNGERVEI